MGPGSFEGCGLKMLETMLPFIKVFIGQGLGLVQKALREAWLVFDQGESLCQGRACAEVQELGSSQ